MSIPSVYHYLPHLIGKPSSLKPALKLSKGRAGGKCINDRVLFQYAVFVCCFFAYHFGYFYDVHVLKC